MQMEKLLFLPRSEDMLLSRADGNLPVWKIEESENPQEEFKYKVMEELATKIIAEDLILKEHETVKWLIKEELDSVEWLPEGITLIEHIRLNM